MIRTIYGVTGAELFRLVSAFMAIRKPAIRQEFLQTLESWANEQWYIVDGKDKRDDKAP